MKTRRRGVSLVHSDEVKCICAEKYLAYIEDLESRIDSVSACVQKQKDRLDVLGVSYDCMQSNSSPRDTLPEGIVKLMELVDKASVDLIEYKEQRTIAEEAIDSLPNFPMRKALRMRYLDGKTWAMVEAAMAYTHSGMMHLRKRAMVELYTTMPEEWRRVLPKAI